MHRRLAAATHQWDESERDPSFLLRGSNLAQFETWAGESLVALTDVERAYVAESTEAGRQERLRERRQNRRLKASRRRRPPASGRDRRGDRRAAPAPVGEARGDRRSRPAAWRPSVIEPRIDRSMLLAREAVNVDGSTQPQGALLSTLLRSPAAIGTFPFPIEARPLVAAVTPDGRTLAVTDNQEEMRFFDTRTHREVHAPLKPAGGFDILGYSRDGSQLFTVGGGGQFGGLEFLDARTMKVLHQTRSAPPDRGAHDADRSARAGTRRRDLLPRLGAAHAGWSRWPSISRALGCSKRQAHHHTARVERHHRPGRRARRTQRDRDGQPDHDP